jgi:hypothetical protein
VSKAGAILAGRHLGGLVRWSLLQSLRAQPTDGSRGRSALLTWLRIEFAGKLLHAKVIEQRP